MDTRRRSSVNPSRRKRYPRERSSQTLVPNPRPRNRPSANDFVRTSSLVPLTQPFDCPSTEFRQDDFGPGTAHVPTRVRIGRRPSRVTKDRA